MGFEKSSEQELISLLNRGYIKAFDEIYRRYHKIIYANIYKLTKSHEEAEELLQDVFIALWQNKEKINTTHSVLNWLIVVGHNKAINYIKKSVKETLILRGITASEITDNTDADESAFDNQYQILEEAIAQLPERKKEAFTLCKLQGKSYYETALILGISTNTVKDHVVSATKFIKSYVIGKSTLTSYTMTAIVFLLQ